jgi:hypothetical protein
VSTLGFAEKHGITGKLLDLPFSTIVREASETVAARPAAAASVTWPGRPAPA